MIVQVVKVTSLVQDGVTRVEPHVSKPTLNCAQLSQNRQAEVNQPVSASPAQGTPPAPKLPFVPWKESNPALTNQQTPRITSLFLLTLVWKSLWPRTALWSSFLSSGILPDS